MRQPNGNQRTEAAIHFYGDGDVDIFNGTASRDYMDGAGGNDIIFGNGGDDRILGGGGDDRLTPGAGFDYIDGGAGIDRLYFFQTGLQHGVNINLHNRVMSDDGFGQQDRVFSIENITASEFPDIIVGSNARNNIFGSHGGDRLFGAGDSDILSGGNGDDTLDGGLHRDRLRGENGNDTFILTQVDVRSGDIHKVSEIIYDFTNVGGERDKIDVSAIDAIAGGGDDPFTWIGTAEFSGASGELRYEMISNHFFVFGDLNGDAVVDFSIKFGNEGFFTELRASDFIL